jgi:tagatose 1,6-diphosphate aldolase GatY/KbaY
MHFVTMSELLDQAIRGGYAVPSFCVWSAQTMQAVLAAAARLKSPVILMNGPGEFGSLRPAAMSRVAAAMLDQIPVRAALHLDHADSLGLVAECLEAGYTSVMLDYSTRPFEENVAGVRQAVHLAKPRGVTVEGELGHVGQNGAPSAESAGGSTLTDPREAAEYVAATGADALAVSIGNAHGQYTGLPRFDFDRLAAIRDAVALPLVLHGGSGTPDEDLRRVISLGVAKVNIATDLVTAVRSSLMEQWQQGRNLWIPAADPAAMQAMTRVVEGWIHRVGAAGRA